MNVKQEEQTQAYTLPDGRTLTLRTTLRCYYQGGVCCYQRVERRTVEGVTEPEAMEVLDFLSRSCRPPYPAFLTPASKSV